METTEVAKTTGNAPDVRHVVVQNSANPDSVTLKKGAKGYAWEIKAYGNTSKDPQGIINRAMQMEADVRARVAVIENQPAPAPAEENITLEPAPAEK